MQIIKKINNNFALAKDDQGRDLVAYGKGIGFPTMPYELNDLSKIDRTFYDVKEEHIPMFIEVDESVITLSMELLDSIRLRINKSISDYLYYVLVDHINFAIERYKKNLYVPMHLNKDIKYNYQREYEVGEMCWKYINQKMNIKLPKDEAAIIAMHIVESETVSGKSLREIDIDALVSKSLEIIGEQMDVTIDHDSFNCYRFETHLKYLIQRLQKTTIDSSNKEMYELIKEKYPKTYTTTEKICEYLAKEIECDITDEEKLYLMLHINRLAQKIEN